MWPIWLVETFCRLEFDMLCHPPCAEGSYSGGLSATGAVRTKSTGGFYQADVSLCTWGWTVRNHKSLCNTVKHIRIGLNVCLSPDEKIELQLKDYHLCRYLTSPCVIQWMSSLTLCEHHKFNLTESKLWWVLILDGKMHNWVKCIQNDNSGRLQPPAPLTWIWNVPTTCMGSR